MSKAYHKKVGELDDEEKDDRQPSNLASPMSFVQREADELDDEEKAMIAKDRAAWHKELHRIHLHYNTHPAIKRPSTCPK